MVKGNDPAALAAGWASAYGECHLCPRHCGVDRLSGETGVCGETAVCRIASACVHRGEEPPVSGRRGSGTIFFTGCSCRCFFCQNEQISRQGLGRDVSPDALLTEAGRLIEQGVHNLNFVTPDHFLPHVTQLCARLRAAGHDLPFVYNTSGYVLADQVDGIAADVQIFLPDFKFADGALARRCMGDGAYPERALEGLRRMVAARGFLEPWDPSGRTVAREGVLVRHLVLPGEVENSLAVLRLLREEFGRMLPLSLMSQYRPMAECQRRRDLDRRLAGEEYRRVVDLAVELDFRSVFIQPHFGDGGFLPDFRRDQPFDGNRPKR